jgi:hypothetical protein
LLSNQARKVPIDFAQSDIRVFGNDAAAISSCLSAASRPYREQSEDVAS